jgi:hypothetical protein
MLVHHRQHLIYTLGSTEVGLSVLLKDTEKQNATQASFKSRTSHVLVTWKTLNWSTFDIKGVYRLLWTRFANAIPYFEPGPQET